MIDQVKGTTHTVPLGLGQPSACPGPPQYQKSELQYAFYPYQPQQQQQQQQQQACCNYHTQQQSHPHPQFYHPYNQVPPQQPRLAPSQQASVAQQPQQPLQIPPQQHQNHNHQQLPSQSLPQQFPQQQPSISQHQQPQHHHLQHQQNHHQHQHTSLHQHHHQQQQQQQQSTSHNTTSHHPHHQPSTSHTPAQEAQTQMAPSPAALNQHSHPTAQDVAALEEEKARLEAHLREMRDRRRCVVCLDKDQGAVFMPCSHLVTCPPCAVTLTTCPVCRTPVQYLVPVILD